MASSNLSILITAKDLATAPLRGLDTALHGLGKAADTALGPLRGLGTELHKVGQIAAGVALGALATQMAGGISGAFKDAIGSTMELGRATVTLQRQIGGSAEEVSGLLSVFGRYGMGVEDASRSLGIFAKHLQGIEDLEEAGVVGGKGFEKTMADIGLRFLDASGQARPMSDMLLDVADRFQAMPDGIDKTATAMALFGRSGKDMIPILNLGRQGMQDAMDTAQKYGLVLTGENVAAVKQFGLAQKDLTAATSGLKLQLGVLLLPILGKVAGGLASAAQQANQFLIPAMQNLAGLIGDTVGPILSDLWQALSGPEAQAALGKFVKIVAGGVGTATDAFGKVADAVRAIFGYLSAGNQYDLMGKLFGPDIGPRIDGVVRAGKGIVTWLTDMARLVPEVLGGKISLGDWLGAAFSGVGDQAGKLGEALGILWAGIDWGAVWNKAGDIAGSIGAWLGTQWAAIDWAGIWKNVTMTAEAITKGLGDIAGTVGAWLGTQWAAIDWPTVWKSVGDIFSKIGEQSANLTAWLVLQWQAIDWALVWANLGTFATEMQKAIGKATEGVPAFGAVKTAFTDVGDAAGAMGAAIGGIAKTIQDHILIQSGLVGIVTAAGTAYILATAATWAHNVAVVAQTVATWAAAAAQGALNVLMTANPIGIVVIALAGLVSGLAYAYNASESFRKSVNDLWADLGRVLEPLRELQRLLSGQSPNEAWRSANAEDLARRRGGGGPIIPPGYAWGGFVPGPVGQPQLAIVHGGEEIRTPAQQRGMGPIYITINAPGGNPAAVEGAARMGVLSAARSLGAM